MEIKQGWKTFKISELCEISSSKRIYQREYKKEGVPFYRSKEIILKHNGKKISELLYISRERYKEIKNKFGVLKYGDILLTSVGTLGIPYIVKESDLFYFKDGNLTWFRNYSEKLYCLYLYYWLLSSIAQGQINSIKIGSSQSALTISSLLNLNINLPNIEVQKRIASILSAYDDLIENNNRRIEVLEEIAQAIYKEWFVHFGFPGHEEVKMVDSELGKIPEGWEVKEIKNFGKIITGKTPSTLIKENYGSYMPFIKIPDMRDNMYIIKTGKYLSKKGTESQNNKIIPSNSLCVSCIGSVGIVSINLVDSQTNQQINSIVLDEKEYLEFLFFKLKSMKKQIENYGGKGATMINLNKREFSELKIMNPTKDLIKKFNKLKFAFFEEIKILLIKNSILRETRDLLLPKLISGEINVENLDIKTEDDIK